MIVADRFLAALPTGEWDRVRVINQGDGMMAGRNWAILAEATSLRYGGKEAFLKCIVVASATAGLDTQFVTGRDRVDRVKARLEACRAAVPAVPLVPILECRFLQGFDGLLIAMERVVTLDALIRSGRGDAALGLKVLRGIAPTKESRWHHFDVCPKNVGMTARGEVVFIDVESFYLVDNGTFDVSVPAWKPFRLPPSILLNVGNDLANNQNRMSAAVGVAKQSFDVAFLAAECSLGGLPDFDQEISEAWLERIATEAKPGNQDLALFWVERLRPAVANGTPIDLTRLTSDLADFIGGRLRVAQRPVADHSLQPVVPREVKPVTDFDRDWEKLRLSARALRRDALGQAEIAEYRRELEALAYHNPTQSMVWDELLLVVISYQRNATDALRLAKDATTHLPNDSNLQRWHQIVAMWAAS